jgi:hypothetical protein
VLLSESRYRIRLLLSLLDSLFFSVLNLAAWTGLTAKVHHLNHVFEFYVISETFEEFPVYTKNTIVISL